MGTWLDVWHLVLGIVARQSPFAQIMVATGAVFVVVMAIEGLRTSLLAIWRAHKAVPGLPPSAGTTLATSAPLSKSFSAGAAARFAAVASRRPKPLTLSPRQFRSPRPKIRRHPMLEFALAEPLHENPANAPLQLRDAL
ncbi:MAG TPA: hypothetical protein VII56_22560 [Rhizomicrobium sp.]